MLLRGGWTAGPDEASTVGHRRSARGFVVSSHHETSLSPPHNHFIEFTIIPNPHHNAAHLMFLLGHLVVSRCLELRSRSHPPLGDLPACSPHVEPFSQRLCSAVRRENSPQWQHIPGYVSVVCWQPGSPILLVSRPQVSVTNDFTPQATRGTTGQMQLFRHHLRALVYGCRDTLR